MAEGILDAPGSVAIELVVHGDEHLRSRPLGRCDRRVRVLDLEREPNWGSTEGARLRGTEVRVVFRHHDGRGPDSELGVDDAPVRCGEPGAVLDRPEGIAVEVERRAGVDDRNVGGDVDFGYDGAPNEVERPGHFAQRTREVSSRPFPQGTEPRPPLGRPCEPMSGWSVGHKRRLSTSTSRSMAPFRAYLRELAVTRAARARGGRPDLPVRQTPSRLRRAGRAQDGRRDVGRSAEVGI